MQINKLLSLFISTVSIFGNNSNAINNNALNDNLVTLEITEHLDVFIGHKNKGDFFEYYNGHLDSIRCSKRLNKVANGCFSAFSCEFENNNRLVFRNVTNTKPCTLLLKCNANFRPNLVFDCGNNRVNFTEIVSSDMNSFKIISQIPLKIKKWISVDTINNKKIVYDTSRPPIIGAIVNTHQYTYFELSVESENI